MRKSLIVILLPSVLIVCGAQTPPTATEAFNLRIRCKQMANEKAEAMQLRPPTPATYEMLEAFHSSKYDVINNRCYIDIYQYKKMGLHKENDVTHRSIYDGQRSKATNAVVVRSVATLIAGPS